MSLKDALLGLLFPPVCLLCGEREEKDGLCASCRKKFARETFLRCPVCHETADHCLCGTDLLRGANTELAGHRFLALTWYVPVKNAAEEPDRVTEKMILMLKDRASFADFFAGELARELNRLFEQAGEDPREWTVSFCPRSAERFMKTGFDQSEEIARRVSKKLGCPAENLFVRVTESEEQKNLGGSERKANARDSILLRKSRFRPGSKVLLIDDILTTGATVSSCAGLLVEAGAAKVFPAVLSRALTKEKR